MIEIQDSVTVHLLKQNLFKTVKFSNSVIPVPIYRDNRESMPCCQPVANSKEWIPAFKTAGMTTGKYMI